MLHNVLQRPKALTGAGTNGQIALLADESANSPSTSAGILHSWSTGCVHPGLGRWQRAECVMAGYPQGVRRAVVVLQGRDRRYWAGHYGAKFALPCLHFWAPDDGSGLASGGRA